MCLLTLFIPATLSDGDLCTYTNWNVYIIGDGCPILNDFAVQNLSTLFPQFLQKIYWYNLEEDYRDEGLTAQKYALKMLLKTRMVICLDNAEKAQAWEQSQRYLHDVIDSAAKRDRTLHCTCKTRRSTK